MNISYSFILYLLIFRLAIIASGIISIILGYRLFVKAIRFDADIGNATSVDARIASAHFTLKNAAPGTCFALFGVLIISVMFAAGSPELTFKTLKNIAETNFSNVKGELLEQTELKLKGETAESIKVANQQGRYYESQKDTVQAIAAYEKAVGLIPPDPLNNLAWLYFKTNKIEESLLLSQLAVHLEPDNANYLDTYSEILYKTEKPAIALKVMENAAKLDSKYMDKLTKFRQTVKKHKGIAEK